MAITQESLVEHQEPDLGQQGYIEQPIPAYKTAGFYLDRPLANRQEMEQYGCFGDLRAIITIGGGDQQMNLFLLTLDNAPGRANHRRAFNLKYNGYVLAEAVLADLDLEKRRLRSTKQHPGYMGISSGTRLMIGGSDSKLIFNFPITVAREHCELTYTTDGNLTVRNCLNRTNSVAVVAVDQLGRQLIGAPNDRIGRLAKIGLVAIRDTSRNRPQSDTSFLLSSDGRWSREPADPTNQAA